MRDNDFNIVSKNIDKIIDISIEEKQTMRHTYEEYNKIRNIILNYINKHNRIISGGYAQNILIKKTSPKYIFYSKT